MSTKIKLISTRNDNNKQILQPEIIDVWSDNLDEVMRYIMYLAVDYPYIAMDTEFPGIVARPVGSFRSNSEYHYQTLQCNVNLLKIIQLGLTFSDEHGNLPKDGRCTWQFNFKFNLKFCSDFFF